MTEVEQATAFGWDMLAVTGSGPEEVAQLVVASTEALGGSEAPEAAHTSDAAFDAAVILFKAVVFVAIGAMGNPPAQRDLSGLAPTSRPPAIYEKL